MLGLVQLFKDAILKFPDPGERARTQAKRKRRRSDRVVKRKKPKPAKKANKVKKAKRRKGK
ncbi:hypothetical protein D3C83_322730 [compost metagenome]